MNKFTLIAGAAAVLVASGAQAAVVNGDFEAGNSGFSSSYGYLAPAGQGTLYPEGKYTVVTDPNSVHNLFSSFGDHTTGTGNMMVVNGATAAGVTVWEETGLAVVSGTKYFFSTWIASAHPQSPAILSFSINGNQIGANFNASASTGVWQQFYAEWTADSNFADIALVNQNLAFSGNDFALDDIALGTLRPGVPEPATWSLMIGGFGLAGVSLRRRRAVAA